MPHSLVAAYASALLLIVITLRRGHSGQSVRLAAPGEADEVHAELTIDEALNNIARARNHRNGNDLGVGADGLNSVIIDYFGPYRCPT